MPTSNDAEPTTIAGEEQVKDNLISNVALATSCALHLQDTVHEGAHDAQHAEILSLREQRQFVAQQLRESKSQTERLAYRMSVLTSGW